jgi:predicted permease
MKNGLPGRVIFERLVADLRLAARKLRAAPGFSVITILTLAVGIGANTALVSAFNSVFLRPLPYPHAERLMHIWARWPGGFGNIPFPDHVAMAARSRSFEDVSACETWGTVALTGLGAPVQLRTTFATTTYLPLLGAKPIVGRLFRGDEAAVESSQPVAILSHPLWIRAFGGAREIVGRTIHLNSAPFTVIGVLPADFHGLGEVEEPPADVWLPISMAQRLLGQAPLTDQAYSIYWGLGLLKEGVSLRQAAQDLEAISRELETEQPNTHRAHRLQLEPAADYVNAPFRRPLVLLVAGAGLILLIACVNVANGLLARLALRRRELALRSAVGAQIHHLVGQLLAECALLAGLGGGLGLLLALWSTRSSDPGHRPTSTPSWTCARTRRPSSRARSSRCSRPGLWGFFRHLRFRRFRSRTSLRKGVVQAFPPPGAGYAAHLWSWRRDWPSLSWSVRG